MKKIYLAGFDVFMPDAETRGQEMKELCRKYGFEGLFPLDNKCESAEEIFRSNTELIRSCDIIAANTSPFRGEEPDSGTSFELGYAFAFGKKLYCYSTDGRTLRERLGKADENGMAVEDFGMSLNLMLAVPSTFVEGTLEDCLKKIAEEQNNYV